MGCDIHAFIEYKTDYESSRHRCLAKLTLNRCYDLFSVLADVRNRDNITCVVRPKGIPTRLSWRAEDAYEEMGTDAHTASWLTEDEVIEALDILPKIKGANTSELKAILAMMQHLKEPRLVFWFDN